LGFKTQQVVLTLFTTLDSSRLLHISHAAVIPGLDSRLSSSRDHD